MERCARLVWHGRQSMSAVSASEGLQQYDTAFAVVGVQVSLQCALGTGDRYCAGRTVREPRPPYGSRPFDRGERTPSSPGSGAVPHQPESNTTMTIETITKISSRSHRRVARHTLTPAESSHPQHRLRSSDVHDHPA